MYPFIYKIECKDELTDNYKIFAESGIVYAKGFAEAAKKLEEFYGDDNIVEIQKLLPLFDDPIVLPAEVINKIENDEYFGSGVRQYVN